MAKETLIVFVYDTESVKEEADDPVKAVLYFHPSWVSNTQKVALCGQLMGISFFLKNCFSKSRIIALQNGKFVLKEFGRFVLAVGTDRNISDQFLLQRTDVLCSLLSLFHRDLRSIYEQFSPQQLWKNLSDKLYQIFETYLPILQCNSNVFFNVPKLRIPKAASNIFLDAIQTLQCCQQTKGILGGTILYHNKVVVSQLSDDLTTHLVLANPMHIRSTAEQIVSTEFHIPNGVQIIVVYIDEEQYSQSAADAYRAQNLQTTQLLQPFQFAKRKIKRDRSLLFTNIPEETTLTEDHKNVEDELAQPIGPVKPLRNRPNNLPLRIKNTNTTELPESGIASINFDETDSFPQFIGQTSVCSTPMTENKVLQVRNVMSICANPEESSHTNDKRTSFKDDIDKFFQNFLSNSPKNIERRNSLNDLQDSIVRIARKLSLKQMANDVKIDVNRNTKDGETFDYIENGDDVDSHSDYSEGNKESSKTTSLNRLTISRNRFQQLLSKLRDAPNGTHTDVEIAEFMEEFKEFDNELQKIDEFLRNEKQNENIVATTSIGDMKADTNLNINEITNEVALKKTVNRKTLCLPIKPLSDDNTDITNTRKNVGSIPLTPLMAKLSILALNEQSNYYIGEGSLHTPIGVPKTTIRRGSLKVDETQTKPQAHESNDSSAKLKRTELYMCGQQNMTLLLLMEQGSASQQTVVQKMFEICVAKFPHMEMQLNQTLNMNVDGDKRDGFYSFLRINSKWDASQRNGPWNFGELTAIESMHKQFQHDTNIRDIILRSNDNIFYGYKQAHSEFYYKEPAHSIGGIPPPSDPIGNVATHAKARLENDHSYIVL